MRAVDYERVAFWRLRDVRPQEIIELMNDPVVRRHLPLARGVFGPVECERFVAAKERMWNERGFGPWAFVLDDEFLGWGGLQPEGEDVDVGLVLRREHWGAGPALYRRIVNHAFRELGVDSVIALLPTSRTRVGALRRLGFREDGDCVIGGQPFVRYRLVRSSARTGGPRRSRRDRAGEESHPGGEAASELNKIFFYGLFMDRTVLTGKDLHPQWMGSAALPGYRIHIGERANLLPSASSVAYGIVMGLTDRDVRGLYSEPSLREYRPERVQVELMETGEVVEVDCYNLPHESDAERANPVYAARLAALVEALGFDPSYVREIAAFGAEVGTDPESGE